MTTLAKSAEDARRVLATMWTIRRFEERWTSCSPEARLYGTVHLYIGEEAVGHRGLPALRDDDVITRTHRGHGHCIAKGVELGRMMAELLGKATPATTAARAASMHIADVDHGMLGANGIVAGGIPIAAGAALASGCRAPTRWRSASSATARPTTAPSTRAINLAAIWKLPVVFVCENNQYAQYHSVQQDLPASRTSPTGPPATASPG